MLTKGEFIELIDEYMEHHDTLMRLSDILDNGNIFEGKVVKYGIMLFEWVIDSNFSEKGSELIYWWLYDDIDPKVIHHDDGREDSVIRTPEDLWNVVSDYIA